jgi:S-(hydroxymethyl)glutathione dehydrogenase/alcohol dehydrogenase
MRFKAAILTELGKPLVIDELEVPKLDVGQVLVRVYASGICGAQLAEISGAKGPDPWLPHLLGHEGGGVVENVGSGVTQVKPGDVVAMHWRKGAGIEAKPPRYKWGGNGWAGGGWVTTFNEYAVVSENRLTKVYNDTPFEIAALMGCAVTTALGLINNEAKLKIGESVIVAGVGGVGLNIIQGAALVGAHPIIAIDANKDKADMARVAGAEHFSDSLMGWDKVDVFVDCTGSPNVIAAGYDLIKSAGGRMVLVGQPDHSCDLTLPGFRRHYCGKTVLDSQGGMTDPNSDIPRYLRLNRVGRLPLEQFITHRFHLDEINVALDVVRHGGAGRVILEVP